MTKSNSTTVTFINDVFEIYQAATYPSGLTFAGSRSKTFSAIRTTAEKASLISNRAMSFTLKPALLRAMGRATVGAAGKSMGSTPASA